MDKDMTFKSERLFFRGLAEDDAEDVVAWRSDPENYRYFLSSRAISVGEHREWFQRYLGMGNRFDFVIVDSDGEKVGTCGLSNIDEESCEISYMIGAKSKRGLGYAKEAVDRLTRLAFEKLGVKCVEARVIAGNTASMAVLTGVGYSECERVFRRCAAGVTSPLEGD